MLELVDKWRYVGTGRQDGLKIRCEQSRESSSLSGATINEL